MKKVFSYFGLCLVLIFVYLPILTLVVYSFTDAEMIGAQGSFSLSNYKYLFTEPELTGMITDTLLLALVSAVLATLLGTTGAIGSYFSRKGTHLFMEAANYIPVVNADVVIGFSLCILMIVVMGIGKETYIPLLAGHVVLTVPFVYLSVMPRLRQMNHHIYEAALDMGATPGKALRKVVIPHLIPGIISGFIMALTLSLDDYFVTIYTKPATFDTISTYVVNATKGSQTEIKTALWALSAVVFLVVVVIVILMNILSGKEKNQNENQ
ncbi:MAG: ABC transporter permease subunit [Lachnoclostridium sp.]|jgi:spermidine/putrescine transport system permease protein|nr:ABC transporter permease subunit [Lachnoclostridium sp.]